MSRDIHVGDQVLLERSGLSGVVRYVGATKFAPGKWVGVELATPEGKNDGSVKNKRYFTCPAEHGIFVKPENAIKVKNGMADVPPPLPGHDNYDTPAESVPTPARRSKSLPRAGSQSELDASLVLGTVHEDLFAAACDFENSNFLRILVEEDQIPLTGADEFGNIVLHAVANSGGGSKAVKVFQYLMEKGLDKHVHARNIYGQTPVMVAARNRRWPEVEYLVSIGADVISKGQGDAQPSVWDCCRNNPQGIKALHRGMEKQRISREEGSITVPKMRHKHSTLVEALFKTAHAGDLKYVRMLLEERDLNVNSQDREGNTCLHWIASDPKRLPIIKYLVAMGAKIHIKNQLSDTPCLIAARSRAWPVMQYLVSIGASISEKDEKNGKSVFKYAQTTMTSRKALADGLAEKKRNNLTDIDPDADILEEKDFDPDALEDENEVRPRPSPMKNGHDFAEEDSAPQPDFDDNDGDQYANTEEVLADIKASGPAPAVADGAASAGTFSGIVMGKKKDKSKKKVCKVSVSEHSILLQYKKGAWYSRKELVEEYKWSDQMSLAKVDDQTLEVTLDPQHAVCLHISPCQPDQLEEFIWKHIWKSVFEVSVREAKQLLVEYDRFCGDTVASLSAKIEEQDKLHQLKRQAQVSGNEGRKNDVSRQLEALEKEIADLVGRFVNIRQQGETLVETFDKMYEALERRLAAEDQRKQEFNSKEQFIKAGGVKKDMDQIKEQMDKVAADKEQVSRLYESMKQAELQYSHFGQDDF